MNRRATSTVLAAMESPVRTAPLACSKTPTAVFRLGFVAAESPRIPLRCPG